MNITRAITQPIQQVVQTAVQVIKESAPIIGAVVCGTLGAVGSPAGIAAGASLGYDIGRVVQTAAQTCLPQDNLKASCSLAKLAKAEIKPAASVALDILGPKVIESALNQLPSTKGLISAETVKAINNTVTIGAAVIKIAPAATQTFQSDGSTTLNTQIGNKTIAIQARTQLITHGVFV